MISLVFQFVILIISVIFHEIAHGYVAARFGDPTARMAGRLTLNPIPHIDPIGSVLLPAVFLLTGSSVFIGWAKPVPVNSRYFKRPVVDMMWVALAGPLTNLTIAFVASLILKALYAGIPLGAVSVVGIGLILTIQLNIVLAVFNLCPIPPLDGSRIIAPFLPEAWRHAMDKMEPYGILIVFGLAYLGLFNLVFSFFLPPILSLLLP